MTVLNGAQPSRDPTQDKLLQPWHYAFAGIVLGLGMLLSLAIFSELHRRQERQTGQEFTRVAGDCQAALRWNLESHVGAAQCFHAFHSATGGIDEDKFRAFAAPLLRQYAGVIAFEWVPRVRGAGRAGWEANLRASGRTEAEITESRPPGVVVRAKSKDEYLPVGVVVSGAADEPVVGLDLSADPTRAEAMRLARDTGRTTGAARITPLTEIGHKPAWTLFHPVYNGTAVPAGVKDRRERLDGFVMVAVRLDELTRETLTRLKAQGITLHIFDGPQPRAEQMVFSYPSHGADPTKVLSGDRLRHVATQELAGRVWTLVYSAAPEFIQGRKSWYPWAGLVLGLTFTGLLVGYVLGITVYSVRIRKLTARLVGAYNDLEDELEDHRHTLRQLHLWEQEFKALAEHSPDIIARFDDKMRHLYVNPRMEDATGHRCAAFVGRTYREMGMPPDMVAAWEEAAKHVFDTGEEATVQITLPSPREPRLYECLLVPEFAQEGFVQTVLAINRDITRRHGGAREAPYANEQRCQELAEQAGR